MNKFETIFDEINLNIDPYKVLRIDPSSNNHTVKEAYKLTIKSVLSPSDREIVELSYRMVKTDILRSRFKLIRNRPFDNLDGIKKLGLKPKVLETSQWIDYLL